jgi:hypothetical protein
MILKNPKIIRAVVPLLVLAISQIYVQARLTTPSTPVQQAQYQAVALVGRLEVHRGKHTQVDGNDAETGQTILDGQTIQTSACTTATVHLLVVGTTGIELGQVDLAANTKAVVHYSVGKANVLLERGCARARVQASIVGSVETPDGKTTTATQPDTLDRKRAEVCYPEKNNQDYSPVCIPPIVWIWGAGAVGTTAAVVATRGANPSPGAPIPR